MEGAAVKSDMLKIIGEDKCPYCGNTYLVNKGIGYAIGEMMVKWKYQCGNNSCRQQFYIRKDLSRY